MAEKSNVLGWFSPTANSKTNLTISATLCSKSAIPTMLTLPSRKSCKTSIDLSNLAEVNVCLFAHSTRDAVSTKSKNQTTSSVCRRYFAVDGCVHHL